MRGVQTPPKSGSLASACQSRSVGAGLMASFAAGSAASAAASVKPAAAARSIAGSARLMKFFMGLQITLFESHNEALMNTGVPFEVLRDSGGADVLDREIRQRLLVQFETREIGGKHQAARGPQQLERPANHADVISLHIE